MQNIAGNIIEWVVTDLGFRSKTSHEGSRSIASIVFLDETNC